MIVTTKRARRQGLTAVAVLVCLVLITMIAGALLKVGLAQRDQVRAREHRLQAEWLAEAGLQRALARLDSDPDYKGETWEISARDLDSADAALVAITIESAPDGTKHRQVRIQADYPRDPARRARHTQRIDIASDHGWNEHSPKRDIQRRRVDHGKHGSGSKS